ncbi:bifunctional diguanylate cyclase/phosphodiesterase [Sphingomonas gilva]|uniref:Bifunctional diguanylate cyclase/phosphodiesterase n=1 Tax=Sphingomonas gilva TaxID=2305907 RepID=A0A396RN64_9SPHN|nr:bifunctional diguanylate cyclase/phosphodiesterase [Sphingomonas gilva]RHW17917.1 bifunctional diguanylate cyclase/phosphodiesterase [Sphingomonas gilva]
MADAQALDQKTQDALAASRAAAGAHINLLPIPAAVVQGPGELEITAANGPFLRAGLMGDERHPGLMVALGARIAGFLASKALTTSFPWQAGSQIDGRQYEVTIARRDANFPGCLVTLVDRTAELRTARHARREMFTDPLTGLLNRAGFADRIEELIDLDQGKPDNHAVLVVDLDRFSRVNACLGGMTGDELLITAARRIKSALRGHDSLARTGGDEFGILLALDNGVADALQVADRVRGALAAPFRLSEFDIRIDCSIGVALGGDAADADDCAQDLIRNAQFAVKAAKATRKVEIYQAGAFDIERRRFGLETDLRRAIDSGELRLSYQPIVDLGSGRIVSFEALTRWRRADGDVSPGDFIPVAEESGLIVPLGRWVMDEAVRTLADWRQRGDPGQSIGMSINLSAIQFQQDDVVRCLRQALAEHKVEGSAMTLELTESAIIGDQSRIGETMRALRRLGARLAMDDFGTGYSSLSLLQKLPIDILKIDRSFVTAMLADRDKLAIVRAILSLAQALGKATTAEGIETNALAQTLGALGCTYGQGYLYAQPLEAEQAYAELCARNQ